MKMLALLLLLIASPHLGQADGKIPKGVFKMGYEVALEPEGNKHGLVFSVETRLYQTCGGVERDDNRDCPPSADGKVNHWVPLEIVVKSTLHDLSPVEIRRLRVGILRFLFKKFGATLQVGSYSFHRDRFDLGERHGLEVVAVTLNEVLDLTKDGNLALVFRGNLAWDLSTLKVADPLTPEHDLDQKIAMSGAIGGSVGMRIAKQVLVDVFGNTSYAGLSQTRQMWTRHFGVGATVKISDWIYAHITVANEVTSVNVDREWFKSYATDNRLILTDSHPGGTLTRSGTVVNGTLEIRW